MPPYSLARPVVILKTYVARNIVMCFYVYKWFEGQENLLCRPFRRSVTETKRWL